MIQVVHPGSDFFYPSRITDLGVNKIQDPGSATLLWTVWLLKKIWSGSTLSETSESAFDSRRKVFTKKLPYFSYPGFKNIFQSSQLEDAQNQLRKLGMAINSLSVFLMLRILLDADPGQGMKSWKSGFPRTSIFPRRTWGLLSSRRSFQPSNVIHLIVDLFAFQCCGSGAFLTPGYGIRMDKNPDPGWT